MDEQQAKSLQDTVEKLDRLVYKLFKRVKRLEAKIGTSAPAKQPANRH
jgi:hypothetical protein